MSGNGDDSNEVNAICESFGRLLDRHWSETDARRLIEEPEFVATELWHKLAEAGFAALMLPPQFSGIGPSAVVLEAIMERAGSALLPGPFLSSAIASSILLSHAGDGEANARLMPGLASGERVLTVAYTGDAGCWTENGVEVSGRITRNGTWQLDGVSSFVTDLDMADTLLVIARCEDGLGIFETTIDVPGVDIMPMQGWDATRRLARVTFSEVPALRIAARCNEAFARSLEMTRIALAAEQAGAAMYWLLKTVEYMKTRVQFGRPIGSFQALKHKAADLLLEAESAISAARAAANAIETDSPDREMLVNLAAFSCADAFELVAAEAIQLHGGIAYTWEHSAHLFWRRAHAGTRLFGSSEFHGAQFLRAMAKEMPV
ncbi:acyl-CoA dehydrogenase family protein [Altererythrobacter sp. Z27]|uniref:acyl-CoA dehydrogenase family protein n=1 Tax=Altererythrobacter sp. Z27 TaxID=3461147 RepID=UPI0040440AD4